MSDKEIAWDLSEIFPSCDHPKISEMLETLKEKADEFVTDYKGKINSPEFTAQNALELPYRVKNIVQPNVLKGY